MDRDSFIADKCDQAGCDDKARRKHLRLFLHEHWDAHPPPSFIEWWEPKRFDSVHGSIGGHDEAWRATPDPRSKEEQHPDMIWDGCKAVTAWNCQRNRDEFNNRHNPKPDLPPVSPTETFLAIKECFDKMLSRKVQPELMPQDEF